MATNLFTEAIAKDRTIDVFNNGKIQRDFTYIDDIIEGVLRIQDVVPNSTTSSPLYKIYNIGNNQPVELEEFIGSIDKALGKKFIKNYLPMQEGDVVVTFADVDALNEVVGFKPETELQVGIDRFVEWYDGYF